MPKGYKGRRPLPSELYFCGRCQRYHLYESQIGEEHAIFKADELKPKTKEDYLLRRIGDALQRRHSDSDPKN